MQVGGWNLTMIFFGNSTRYDLIVTAVYNQSARLDLLGFVVLEACVPFLPFPRPIGGYTG